jgi:hypothetical protein
MGIRLDWEVEAEQSKVQRAGEEPDAARRRRAGRIRFLVMVLIFLGLIGSAFGFVYWRLQDIDQAIERSLRSTVETEITALRLGDFTAFATLQRSASDQWLQSQQQLFSEYQALKLRPNVQLTGQIVDLTIDRTRARVAVQEIIEGIPYTRVWFYWRYDDGWRHVPPDYTFWGETQTYSAGGVTVHYQAVDAQVGETVGARVTEWLNVSCAILQCPQTPLITIEIVPDETAEVGWLNAQNWTLQVPSPYVRRARSDMPFDLANQNAVASLLAEQLIQLRTGAVSFSAHTDAAYIRQSVVNWLVSRFTQTGTSAYLVDSLVVRHGDSAMSQLVTNLRPESTLDVVASASGLPVEQSNLDWRDFVLWRLQLEAQLIDQRDDTLFLTLYDTRDAAVRDTAYQRFSAALPSPDWRITSVQVEGSGDGIILRSVVSVGEGDAVTNAAVDFRWVNGTWLRIN